MNYSELLQLAKGWGNFVSDRINIWRLQSTCQKERFVMQGAEHTGAIKTDKGLYLRKVSDFIQRTVYTL